ncbi:MAG: hypothetical protein KGL35_00990 [Bradyrhizobium sp.]|nr:hypothetical protein [Bradyrhizobium sp.]
MCVMTHEESGRVCDPLATMKERHRKLLRDQDIQLGMLRALLEDMREMNREALADLDMEDAA